MANCDACGSMILFGGIQDGNYRFCNENCHQKGSLLILADQIPRDVLEEHLQAVFRGKCPKCGSEGPVDVHMSHSVWSALIMTSWKSTGNICCKSCGVKSQVLAALGSLVLGWWGFPWGLIMTPFQISRNLIDIFKGGDPDRPSQELEKQIKLLLAEQVILNSHQNKDY